MTYCYYCTRHLSILHCELFSSLVLLLSHDGIFYQIYLSEKRKKKTRNPERKALETTEGIINHSNWLTECRLWHHLPVRILLFWMNSHRLHFSLRFQEWPQQPMQPSPWVTLTQVLQSSSARNTKKGSSTKLNFLHFSAKQFASIYFPGELFHKALKLSARRTLYALTHTGYKEFMLNYIWCNYKSSHCYICKISACCC